MADPSTYAIRQQQALAQIRSVMENHAVEAGQYPLFSSDGSLPSSPEQMDELAAVLAESVAVLAQLVDDLDARVEDLEASS
jgi:hypothetical protein